MKTLIAILALNILPANNFKAGQCDQFCKMFPDGWFKGGVWLEKEKSCRCFDDFSPEEMGIMRMPLTIRKTPEPGNSISL